MERIRTEKNKDYTVINNTFLKDKRLTLKAKGFFALVMSLPDNWDFSINGMVAITKEGKTAIYAAIKELMQNGYCIRTYLYDAGKRVGVDYLFKENLNLENLNLGNQPQLSKEVKQVKKEENTKREKEPLTLEILEQRKHNAFELIEAYQVGFRGRLRALEPLELTHLLKDWWEAVGSTQDFKDDNAIRQSFNKHLTYLISKKNTPKPEPQKNGSKHKDPNGGIDFKKDWNVF